MSAYQSRYAEFYDVIYANKPYPAEIAFLDQVLRTPVAPNLSTWLDVACGSGNHALELVRRGYTVTGLDYSKAQLQLAQAKRARLSHPLGDRLTFVEGDMCTFDLGSLRFDVVSCLFDSLGYAVTNQGIVAALQRMRHHLAPGGRVVLEFWHAAAMLTGYEPKRLRRIPSQHGELVRTSETTIDVANQTCSVKFNLLVPQEDAPLELTETHVCRFFLLQEMAALLELAGLRVCQAFAGFDATTPIDANTWHIVVVASAVD